MYINNTAGTSLGGGTLWGLLSLLTDAESYDDMLELSKKGDNKNVDMLVGDIYGGGYSKIGLKATTIASSFGKVFKSPKEERKKLKHEDISKSLLLLVSNNIGQIAFLNAQAHGIQKIFFSGFFIRGHPITMNTLSYAIDFWSQGKIKALFLRHEGYLGAVGAFLSRVPIQTSRSSSFTENFSHISKISGSSVSAVGVLDASTPLSSFPLLAGNYKCDTIELTEPDLQTYWINLLEKNLKDFLTISVNFGIDKGKLKVFETLYKEHLERLRKEPGCYGLLTVRKLLDLREQCLKEVGIYDVFEGVKKKEIATSLQEFPALVSSLDALKGEEKSRALVDNILCGNMYDWG